MKSLIEIISEQSFVNKGDKQSMMKILAKRAEDKKEFERDERWYHEKELDLRHAQNDFDMAAKKLRTIRYEKEKEFGYTIYAYLSTVAKIVERYVSQYTPAPPIEYKWEVTDSKNNSTGETEHKNLYVTWKYKNRKLATGQQLDGFSLLAIFKQTNSYPPGLRLLMGEERSMSIPLMNTAKQTAEFVLKKIKELSKIKE